MLLYRYGCEYLAGRGARGEQPDERAPHRRVNRAHRVEPRGGNPRSARPRAILILEPAVRPDVARHPAVGPVADARVVAAREDSRAGD